MHQYHTSALSNEVYNFVFTQRAQKLSAIKFQMHSFHSKTDFTFLLQLITFKPLDLKQSYIPHLKVLMCGINAFSPQWCSCIFTLCYTHLKSALLLHKTATAKYILHSTVVRWQLERTMYDFKNSFSPDFVYIQRAKYIFFRDMFCLSHFCAF